MGHKQGQPWAYTLLGYLLNKGKLSQCIRLYLEDVKVIMNRKHIINVKCNRKASEFSLLRSCHLSDAAVRSHFTAMRNYPRSREAQSSQQRQCWWWQGTHSCTQTPRPLTAVFFALGLVGILVPWPGIEPTPSATRVQSPDQWTAREVSDCCFLAEQSPEAVRAQATDNVTEKYWPATL